MNELNSTITDAEIQAVIKSMPNNKSPGADGFTAQYYKTYQDVLVMQLFNQAASFAFFPQEMWQAAIVTLPKLGKVLNCPKFLFHFPSKLRPKNVFQTACK